MNFAPIIIPTLDRYKHLEKCISSLQRCTNANKTDLIVSVDYPISDKYASGQKKIIEYLSKVEGFAKKIVIEQKSNLGAKGNFLFLIDYVLQVYENYIYMEDDNEFSPNFLEYINKGLERFKDDPRIIAVCGDGGLFKKPSDYDANYLYRKGFSAWGYGTWKGRLGKTEYTVDELEDFVKNTKYRKKLKYYYERHYYSVLSYIKNGKTMWGDGAIALEMIKNDTYCVYPTVSKVRNHGHDGSGEHGGKMEDSPFAKVGLDHDSEFNYIGNPVFDDRRYMTLMRNYSRVPYKEKIRIFINEQKKYKAIRCLARIWRLAKNERNQFQSD